MLGALILAFFVARGAQIELAKSAGLGSVESLAELSSSLSTVARELELERASAYEQGLRAPIESADPERAALHSRIRAELASGSAPKPTRRSRGFRGSCGVVTRPSSRRGSPAGSGRPSESSPASVAFRARSTRAPVELAELVGYYGAINRSPIASLAALGELSDDGELLRSIHSLVTTLELAERVSAEHALVAYVLAARTFPPGSYRQLVTLVTGAGHVRGPVLQDLRARRTCSGCTTPRPLETRSSARGSTETRRSRPPKKSRAGTPKPGTTIQKLKLERVEGVAKQLNQRVAAQATRKLAEIRSSRVAQRGARLRYARAERAARVLRRAKRQLRTVPRSRAPRARSAKGTSTCGSNWNSGTRSARSPRRSTT